MTFSFFYERFLALRWLLRARAGVLSTVTLLSCGGVALGVWLVIVSLAILSGFEHDLETKIIGVNAPVILQSKTIDVFELKPDALLQLKTLPNVTGVTPSLETEVAFVMLDNVKAAKVYGIDIDSVLSTLHVFDDMQQGSLQALQTELPILEYNDDDSEAHAVGSVPGVLLGSELANTLRVSVGDRIRMISPTLDVLTPLGVAPKSMGVRVVGIFSTHMYEYDSTHAYVLLPTLQHFLEVDQGFISSVHVAVHTLDDSASVAKQAESIWNNDHVQGTDWRTRHRSLFAALELERQVAFVVLTFIVLVASFSIVNTLAMSVIDKRKHIAMLKAMGARSQDVVRIFWYQGLWVGALGIVLGTCFGLLTVFVLERFGVHIPGDVYYIQSLPVYLRTIDVSMVVCVAVLLVLIFAMVPAFDAAKLHPVEGLRDG